MNSASNQNSLPSASPSPDPANPPPRRGRTPFAHPIAWFVLVLALTASTVGWFIARQHEELGARKRFDEWSWLELSKREIDVVHLDTNVGDGVTYQVPAQPLATGQQAILVQNAAQQLPWQPGLIKLNADWTGTKAPSLVTINFWSGIAGITNIADPVAAGLIQIGSSYKLSDFECAQDCYLAPWPKLFGCGTNAIPDTRRVYVEVRVGAVGAATLSSYSVTVLKRATAQCDKWTNIYRGCNKG